MEAGDPRSETPAARRPRENGSSLRLLPASSGGAQAAATPRGAFRGRRARACIALAPALLPTLLVRLPPVAHAKVQVIGLIDPAARDCSAVLVQAGEHRCEAFALSWRRLGEWRRCRVPFGRLDGRRHAHACKRVHLLHFGLLCCWMHRLSSRSSGRSSGRSRCNRKARVAKILPLLIIVIVCHVRHVAALPIRPRFNIVVPSILNLLVRLRRPSAKESGEAAAHAAGVGVQPHTIASARATQV